jgi:hypothetical protein
MTFTNAPANDAFRKPLTDGRIFSPKIHPWHIDRLAIVYVRQSTPQQVAENRESTDRQYALVNRAIELGWSPERILVVDQDQGKSGATDEDRLGFQRLLAEVSLDHVGLILGLEMSRLARSCKDWHQLLELCALFRTLLADQDGLYDPTDHIDRLLLGLTGIMSEAELHVLRGRMRQGWVFDRIADRTVVSCSGDCRPATRSAKCSPIRSTPVTTATVGSKPTHVGRSLGGGGRGDWWSRRKRIWR